MLGTLVCTTLAGGLVEKWMPVKSTSERTTLRVGTSAKRSDGQSTKKGKGVGAIQNGELLQVDPEASLELKEALGVGTLEFDIPYMQLDVNSLSQFYLHFLLIWNMHVTTFRYVSMPWLHILRYPWPSDGNYS